MNVMLYLVLEGLYFICVGQDIQTRPTMASQHTQTSHKRYTIPAQTTVLLSAS